MGVTYASVAMDTGQHVPALFCREHVIDQGMMAVDAGRLHDPTVAFLDLNGVFKIARRKGQRVKKSIVCLGDVLGQQAVVRRVTIVAHCHRMMAGL